MTAQEIREEGLSSDASDDAYMLREIAAQLAELNETLKFIAGEIRDRS